MKNLVMVVMQLAMGKYILIKCYICCIIFIKNNNCVIILLDVDLMLIAGVKQ